MRVVIQRVSRAIVKVDSKITGQIENGLLVLAGIENDDTVDDIKWISNKITNLRIFDDDKGVMNNSVKDIDGDVLLISQFTLYASTRKGNRPSYSKAAKSELAIPLYEELIISIEEELGKHVECGIFGADMKVELLNDGPVTIIIDSKNRG